MLISRLGAIPLLKIINTVETKEVIDIINVLTLTFLLLLMRQVYEGIASGKCLELFYLQLKTMVSQ